MRRTGDTFILGQMPHTFSGIDYRADTARREKFEREEAEVRRMLGCWVSELEPAVLYMRDRLVGLGLSGMPEGSMPSVVVKAWER